MSRRGVTGVETLIVFLAALLTVAAFSFVVVTLRSGSGKPEVTTTIGVTSEPSNATLTEVNATDQSLSEFIDYVFGTWERISGVFQSDFTSIKTD